MVGKAGLALQIDEYSPRATSPSRTTSLWNRVQGLLSVVTDVFSMRRLGFNVTQADELRYLGNISVWLRWMLIGICVALLFYRPDFDFVRYAGYSSILVLVSALNGFVHFRILANRKLTHQLILLLSIMDVVFITGAIIASGGFDYYFLFMLYNPALAGFAVLINSFRVNIAWATLVALTYATVSIFVGDGLDLAAKEEKTLFARVVVMFLIGASFNLVARFERVRRQEAVARERELHQDQIRLAKAIHDTTAQSAYMVGLGMETALELAQNSSRELVNKLEATYRLSKSAMWELRHPIDISLIVEGRNLDSVLESHAATFTAISSIPAEVVQTGQEPPLSPVTRRALFSIAHNALTNAFRHSQAGKVTINLDYGENRLRMSVSDNGIGLPDDYTQRGHGFKNMRLDAERIGGRLEVNSGTSGQGTTVTCIIG